MIIGLTKLSEAEKKFSGEDPCDIFEWQSEADEVLTPAGPVRWDVKARIFETELLVTGTASAEFAAICCRCGKSMTLTIRDDLCVSMEIIGEASEVDLTFELRDAILLALPSHPVCQPECKGVCPKCGKPRSDGACDCSDAGTGGAWDILDNLFNNRTE